MDGSRGFALCGIVLLNVYNFAMSPSANFNPLAYGTAGAMDLAIWAVESIIAQDAFRAVFAVMSERAGDWPRAGPLSLSRHIGPSILMAALHSWGLAGFGDADRVEAMPVALAVIGLVLHSVALVVVPLRDGALRAIVAPGARALS